MPTQKPPQPPQPPAVVGTEVKVAQQREQKPPLPCLVEVGRQPPVSSKKPQRRPVSSESTKLSTQELLAEVPVRERQAHNLGAPARASTKTPPSRGSRRACQPRLSQHHVEVDEEVVEHEADQELPEGPRQPEQSQPGKNHSRRRRRRVVEEHEQGHQDHIVKAPPPTGSRHEVHAQESSSSLGTQTPP